MFAPPPSFTNITLRTTNTEVMEDFYFQLGMLFNKWTSQGEREFFTYSNNYFEFCLIEVVKEDEVTRNLEFTLVIDEIDGYLEDIKNFNLEIITQPWNKNNFRYMTFRDPDGHIVNLKSKNYS